MTDQAPDDTSLEIKNSDLLYRRIHPDFYSNGIVSSSAYKLNNKPDPNISVDRANLTTPQESVNRARKPEYKLGQLVAELPRSLGLKVCPDPIFGNDSHALIKGNSEKSICRRLAESTLMVCDDATGALVVKVQEDPPDDEAP